MNFVKLCLLLLTSLCGTIGNAQTADEIISKHIEATGGKEKLAAINSLRIENAVQVMGNEAANETLILNGKGYRTETDAGGQRVIEVYTDKNGWAVNPFGGSDVPAPMPAGQYQSGAAQIYIVPFLNYIERGEKAELLGQEKIGTVNAYKIKVTDKNASSITYFFDPATYYIIRASRAAQMMGQSMDMTISYSDFKKSDYGWVVPQAITIDYGGQFSMDYKVVKLEINAPVQSSVFEMKK